jgi:hypothetical protein
MYSHVSMNDGTHINIILIIGASTPAQEAKSQSEDENSDDSDDSSSDDENAFPDTQLKSLTVNTTNKENEIKADKYDLEDYGQDSDEQDSINTPTSGSNTPAKKFITAKERRMMKKSNLTEITDEIKEKQQKQKQAKPTQTPAKPKETVPPAATRGRKGKAKKIKDKYADQDEEERQLRMELIAVCISFHL